MSLALLMFFRQRCWHDDDLLQDIPPLEHGEVGVSFWTPKGTSEILHENQLCLLDRVFQLGDYCKRSVEDLQSGVIIDVKVKGRFEHAISHQHTPGWFTTEDLKERTDAEIGDYVAYDDWIGQVRFFNNNCERNNAHGG
jgi:ubiquitin-conjugating enzyme E2 O